MNISDRIACRVRPKRTVVGSLRASISGTIIPNSVADTIANKMTSI
jgi:hypothetical protein